MTKGWRKVALAFALAFLTGVAHAGDLKPGDPIPAHDLRMKNVDGRMLSLADIKGERGTLVVFSCNHCPFVKAWQGRMVAIGNEYGAKGVGVIFINANDPAIFPSDGLQEMKELAAREGYRFPYVVDATSDVGRSFGATRTPEAFLFDGAGRLIYHGAVDDNAHEPARVERRYLRDALDALLDGGEVAVKEVPSIGCTIKLRSRD